MLVDIKDDYQFDPKDPGYLGFINVGLDQWVGEEYKRTWTYIVSKPDLFYPIFEELGLEVAGHMRLDETVFFKK